MRQIIRSGVLALLLLIVANNALLSAKSNLAIIEAAQDGRLDTVRKLLDSGADVNVCDNEGRTALHRAAENGHLGTVQLLLNAGANPNTIDKNGHTPLFYAQTNGHSGTASLLRAFTTADTEAAAQVQRLNPALKYPDLAAFESAIGQEACVIKSEHVYFFAPKLYETEANIVFPYLAKAYDALRQITGTDTEYIVVVYNFPKGHSDASGGTSNCTLWYDDSNLRLDQHQEWNQHKVPHVSGYIEEMAHNFVAATKAQFGWEMVGWSIGAEVCAKVAGNPIHSKLVESTRQEQARTFQRYLANKFSFPADLPGNLVDRIHAHLLWQCEQKYGPTFWIDFFNEIGKHKKELVDAVTLGDGDAIRNERYRITVECFDKLGPLHFREMLKKAGISLTTDVKSLHPTDPTWNRRLL